MTTPARKKNTKPVVMKVRDLKKTIQESFMAALSEIDRGDVALQNFNTTPADVKAARELITGLTSVTLPDVAKKTSPSMAVSLERMIRGSLQQMALKKAQEAGVVAPPFTGALPQTVQEIDDLIREMSRKNPKALSSFKFALKNLITLLKARLEQRGVVADFSYLK